MIASATLTAVVTGFAASAVFTAPVRSLAVRFGFVDHPGPRKVHAKPMPLLGGVAIYLGFVAAVLLAHPAFPAKEILGILAGATLVAIVGFLDDAGLLHHQVKLFIGMPIAAAILVLSGIRSQLFSSVLPGLVGAVLDIAFTIFWVVGFTAAFSILDHMDGLCAGVAAIAAAFFMLVATAADQPPVAALGAALLGAAAGFLLWNFNPAKIFMGDGGAMFLGFASAALGLKIHPSGLEAPVRWLVPILILAVPVFDTTLISISRSRRGLIPFTSPGKDHTAHRLSNLGLGHRRAVLAIYALGLTTGLLALFATRISLTQDFALAIGLVLCAMAAIFALESVPFERQVKVPKTTPAS